MARLLLATLALFALAPASADASRARNVRLMAHLDHYPGYSSCASYVHHDGREYAVIGTTYGTSIVNVTDPERSAETAFIPGPPSTIREMKQYRTWIYIIADVFQAGVQIVRMTDPDRPLLVGTYFGGFTRAHTVQVDTTRALLYLNHSHYEGLFTGLRIVSLANPESPADLIGFPSFTFHDTHVRESLLFGFAPDRGRVSVLDMTDPLRPSRRGSWTYPGAYTHSGETSRDGNYLYVCDELGDVSMKVFDIHDLGLPSLVHRTIAHPLATVHNVRVRGDTAYVAYYTEGVRLYDVADPSLPAEWGYYDTFDGVGPDWLGAWDVAHFPSGTIAVSDTRTGLYVLRPIADYGTVTVTVIDESGAPAPDVDVLISGGPDSTRTQGPGRARLALAPGAGTLLVRKFPYQRESVPVLITRGGHETRSVALRRLPPGAIAGTVRRAGDRAPVADARIEIWDTPLVATTDGLGGYRIEGVPPEEQLVRCERPGYVPRFRVVAPDEAATATADWVLRPAAWYDDGDEDRGWTFGAPGDGISGGWLRAPPVLAKTTITITQPLEDHTPGSGGACYVAGNAGDPSEPVHHYDVDGRQTLTSPPLDLGGMVDPTIGYWYWFVALYGEANLDELRVELSGDGVDWVSVRRVLPGFWDWRRESIRVRDHVPSAETVWLRFVASDLGEEGVVEAAIDDIEVHDAALPEPGEITAAIDVRPGACPAPLNTASRGVLPVIVYGSEALDPRGLDPATIRLEGVSPQARRMTIADVGSPAAGRGDPCGCEEGGPDGRGDLLLHFDIEALARALGPEPAPQVRTLRLIAMTQDGDQVVGEDCVRVLAPPGRSRRGAALHVFGSGASGAASIRYDVPRAGAEVSIDLYAVDGRRVRRLAQGPHPPGSFERIWDGTDEGGRTVARGVYFVLARIDEEVLRARLVLMR